jgi:hypothetical protein
MNTKYDYHNGIYAISVNCPAYYLCRQCYHDCEKCEYYSRSISLYAPDHYKLKIILFEITRDCKINLCNYVIDEFKYQGLSI